MTETHSCTASSPEDAETSARQMIDAINRAERALTAAKKIAARKDNDWKTRAEAAEAHLAVVEKALVEIAAHCHADMPGHVVIGLVLSTVRAALTPTEKPNDA